MEEVDRACITPAAALLLLAPSANLVIPRACSCSSSKNAEFESGSPHRYRPCGIGWRIGLGLGTAHARVHGRGRARATRLCTFRRQRIRVGPRYANELPHHRAHGAPAKTRGETQGDSGRTHSPACLTGGLEFSLNVKPRKLFANVGPSGGAREITATLPGTSQSAQT